MNTDDRPPLVPTTPLSLPPGTVDLNNTLGPVFMGNIVIAVLYGISCVQMYIYHQRSLRDSRVLKTLVLVLWILDTAQLVFWTVALYNFCVTNFSNLPALLFSPWSFVVDYAVGLLSDILVTCIYTYRLWKLNGRFLWVQIGVQVLSILVSSAMASAYIGVSWGKIQVVVDQQFGWLMLVDFGAKFFGDICITISLWMTLRRMRTGVHRTESLIRTLVLYSMSTCALTSVSILGTMIALAAAPHTLIYDAFSTILPKLVFNSLLAFLNSREYFTEKHYRQEPLSVHLSRLPQYESDVVGKNPSKLMYVDEHPVTSKPSSSGE